MPRGPNTGEHKVRPYGLITMCGTKMVNFKKNALVFPGKVAKESKHNRIQRLFAKFPFDSEMVARFIDEKD